MTFWSESELKPWLETLHNNGVAAAPAEGVYGYVANPFSTAALESLMTIKQRDPAKGVIVLISGVHQLPLFTDYPADNIPTFPTPTTLLLPALTTLPQLLTGGQPTIAVRLPTTAYMLEYLNAFGAPLVSTSLNISGQPAATQPSQILTEVPALTLKGALSGTPSRIYNPMENKWLR